MNYRVCAVVAVLCAAGVAMGQIKVNEGGVFGEDTVLYREPYRPAYHFTPAHRWIGDPCGLLRHGGRYLAYSWGCAESDDLVHWTERNRDAIKGLPANIAPFTGSVVVDSAGSGGWGKGAVVAAFTSFDKESKKQSQSVAFSHDGGMTFSYYDGNPVLDIWSTEFRDPTVIRYNDRWVMAVAKALEKKVAFYVSDDLRRWEWVSDFGPMGDNERSWECPDLFQLEVEGTGEKKWVLVVSVNWAREQYFTGEFDGREFVPDEPYAEPLYVDEGLDYYASRVFQDYDKSGVTVAGETPVYTLGWVNTWDYAQQAPSKWGKGVWSLPRRLSLVRTDSGLRLVQHPAEALHGLRGDVRTVSRRLRAGVTDLPAVGAMGNQYELEVKMDCASDDVAGLMLCCGEGRKLTLSYDAASGRLTVDRTNTTDARLPKFSRICSTVIGESPDLTIYVDRSTVEIFTADGRTVMTMLTYAAPDQTGAAVWSLRGGTKIDLKAWPLRSIH